MMELEASLWGVAKAGPILQLPNNRQKLRLLRLTRVWQSMVRGLEEQSPMYS